MQKNEVFSRVFRSATDMFAPTLNRGGEADQPRRRGGGVFNALKTGGSYCYGCELKLPNSLQTTSVAESNGLSNKTFYQKVFAELFSISDPFPPFPAPPKTNLYKKERI